MDFYYYHLAYNPFAMLPPDAVFWHRQHQIVWDRLALAVAQHQGFVILIGTTGLGKTTLLKTYQARANPASNRVITDLDASHPYPGLLLHLAQACHLNDALTDSANLARRLQTHLTEENAQGRNTVVLIDDAHTLSIKSLKNLQQLSEQTATPNGPSLQIVLAGRPALEQHYNRAELPLLTDPANTVLTLQPLSPEESMDYIQHHLDCAATQSQPVFAKGAVKLIVDYAQGIPKAINIMSTDVLVVGLLRGERPISSKAAWAAIGEASDQRTLTPFLRWSSIGAASLLLLIGLWYVLTPSPALETQQVASSAASTPLDTLQNQSSLTQRPSIQIHEGSEPSGVQSTPRSSTPGNAQAPQTPVADIPAESTRIAADQLAPSASMPVETSPTTLASAALKTSNLRADATPSSPTPATPIAIIAPTSETSQPIEFPPREGVLQATLDRIEPPRHPATALAEPEPSAISAVAPPLDSKPEPTGPDSLRMVCVMPRARGQQGSDIVLIDDNPLNGMRQNGIQQLVSDGLQNMSPALSPDGKLLAYTSYRNGTPNIYLRNLSTKQDTQITSGPWLALPGNWSPNGRYLALSQSLDGNNDIFLYDVQQRRLRRLTTHRGLDVSPSFAPDSHRLVFASDRTGSPQLYLTDVNGSPPTRLTQTGPYNTSPAWSPESNRIAFIGRSSDRSLDLYLIQANGKQLQRLTQGQRFHSPPTWAPTGNILMGMSLRGSIWERHVIHVTDQPSTTRWPQTGPLCLAPQWVAQHRP